jgi:hypothetical protein
MISYRAGHNKREPHNTHVWYIREENAVDSSGSLIWFVASPFEWFSHSQGGSETARQIELMQLALTTTENGKTSVTLRDGDTQ